MAIVLLLLYMVTKLFIIAIPALEKFGFGFLVCNVWDPYTGEFGAAPFVYGTLVSSAIALLIAGPVSVGTALFLTQLASPLLAKITSILVETLAAIPSVVYGLWGIFVLIPLLEGSLIPFLQFELGFIPLFSGPAYGRNMLTAGIVLAIMIIPTITSICREIFLTTPVAEREAALAVGATRWEMISLAILKSCRSGILVAMILGLGRAFGETMAVTMLIGNRNDIALSLLAPAQTMASLLANEYNEASDDLHLSALVAIGFTLFMVALVTNGLARLLSIKIIGRSVK